MNKKSTKLLILFVLISCTYSFAQTASKVSELSNAEKFSAKSGTLMQKEFVDVGIIKKAAVKVIKYKDLISSQKISAVRFEYEVAGSYSNDTKIASLDADEIDGLITSIKMMQSKIFTATPEN